MKAKVSVEKLSGVLELVRRVPSEKSPIPASSGVLLEFLPDNILKIHANNTRQWVLVTLDEGVSVEDAGEIVVPAKRFIGWVKTFNGGEVSFSLDSKDSTTLVLSVGKARTKIKCFEKSDFLEVPSKQVGDTDITFKLDSGDFEKKTNSVVWAFKNEKDALLTHRAVNMLCRQDGSVQIRTFDGVGSLSFVNLKVENPVPRPEEFSVFVPDDLLSALVFTTGEIAVAVTEKKVEFIQDKLMGGGLALVGQFPDPSPLLRGFENLPEVRLPVDTFKSAVGRLDVILDNSISCVFDMSETDFVLRSEQGLQSSVSEHIPVSTSNFEPGKTESIALSLPYTKSLLSHYFGGELVFRFNQKMVLFSDPAIDGDWTGLMAQMVRR